MARHRREAQTILPGCQSVLVFAASYFTPPSTPDDPAKPSCKVAKYALGEDYHLVFREKLEPIVEWLSTQRPGHQWRICTDSAPLLERAYATQSGIGFLAKNTMVISPGNGSFFLLAEVLTTATIEPDDAITGTCGNCTRCIDACPTAAIVAPFQLDARRCISYLTIEKKSDLTPQEADQLHGWAFGCDICQDVCPYNKAPLTAAMTELQPGRILNFPEPLDTFLAPKSNSQFDHQFPRSPLQRPGRRRLQRNAKLAANEQ